MSIDVNWKGSVQDGVLWSTQIEVWTTGYRYWVWTQDYRVYNITATPQATHNVLVLAKMSERPFA